MAASVAEHRAHWRRRGDAHERHGCHIVKRTQAHFLPQGLETDTPFLTIGTSMFAGAWDEALGSEILLYDTHSERLLCSLCRALAAHPY